MIIIFHFLIGSILITIIPDFLLAFLIILITHYLLDFLPHWEYSIKNIKKKKWKKSLPDFLKIVLDFAIGILIVSIFFKNPFIPLIGGFLGVLPDGLIFLQLVIPNKMLNLHSSFHNKIHILKNNKNPLIVIAGLLIKVLIITIFILFSMQR